MNPAAQVYRCTYCKQDKPGTFKRRRVGSFFRQSATFCCHDCDRRLFGKTSIEIGRGPHAEAAHPAADGVESGRR